MNKKVLLLCVWAVLLLALEICSPQHLMATVEYAKQTGRSCSACHRDPAGGGELTATGTAFSATLHNMTEKRSPAMREIGILVAAAPRKEELHEKVFYFMAYMKSTPSS